MRVGNDGNCSIGTTSNTNKLRVHQGSDNANIIIATGADESSEFISLGINSGVPTLTAGGVGSTDASLAFRTADNGTETERLRITSNGTIQLASGCPGIDFSQVQTNAGGMTSETLDSYEEGTWEPTFTSTAGDFTSVTYNADTGGRYVKIGSVVTVNGCARCTAIDTSNRAGSDTLCIGGLPFANTSRTNGDNADSLGALRVPVWGNTDNCPHIIQARQNQTFCTLINLRINNVHSTNLVSQANNSMMVQFSLTYRTAQPVKAQNTAYQASISS